MTPASANELQIRIQKDASIDDVDLKLESLSKVERIQLFGFPLGIGFDLDGAGIVLTHQPSQVGNSRCDVDVDAVPLGLLGRLECEMGDSLHDSVLCHRYSHGDLADRWYSFTANCLVVIGTGHALATDFSESQSVLDGAVFGLCHHDPWH